MMRFGVSDLVRKIVERELIEAGKESVTSDGFTFSVEKTDGSIPTGLRTNDGKMVYIQP